MLYKFNTLLVGLLLLLILEQCKTKSHGVDKIHNKLSPQLSRSELIINSLKNCKAPSKADIVYLNVIDTFYSYSAGDFTYCDTTVYLNDSIFYSIISLSDTFGICSYYFILTIDSLNKKVVTSKYLEPACNIDYSADWYDLYKHKIITEDTIQLTRTIVYQKKDRTSNDDNENIDHKDTERSYFIISPAGQINSSQ